ncbi:MAG: hypothetical protein WBC93_03630 [Sulfitobacter sp.]
MQLVLHTGAHFTEEDRLIKCLLRNKGDFAARGVSVPGPGKYRRLLSETLMAMREAPAAPGARDVLMDAILDDEPADRLILSNAHFFAPARGVVNRGMFYARAEEKMAHMVRLFPHDQIELFMAIRNPASFLPACFQKMESESAIDFLDGSDPRVLRWSELLIRLRKALPEVQITVWCNEDAPLIWGQIIREMAALEHGQKITGAFDLLRDIMTREGMLRFRAYLKKHPKMSELQRRQVVSAFLDKFALDEAVEEELDMPGWTDSLVDELTEIYDEDAIEIGRIPGVQVISP